MRNLHLHLIPNAGFWIGPIVRHDKATGRRRSQHGATDLIHRGTGSSGLLTINLHVDCRIVQRLHNLSISQHRNIGPRLLHSFQKVAIFRDGSTSNSDLDRCRRAEAHHFADNVGRLKRKPHVRKFLSQSFTQSYLHRFCTDTAARLQSDSQDCLFRSS